MGNRVLKAIAVILVIGFGAVSEANAQIYVKLNVPYALVGLINPAVEFKLSPKSTFQTEFTVSPWKYIRWYGVNRPMTFIIFSNEYRRYFKQHNQGWYAGLNAGMMAFNMTKPLMSEGRRGFKNTSSKGYGFMLGATAGYQWRFKDKWILDAFAGLAWMNTHYNAYALVDGVVEGGRVYNRGETILTPGVTDWGDKPVDPLNGSGEWLPNKIGVSLGILIFDPQKRIAKKGIYTKK